MPTVILASACEKKFRIEPTLGANNIATPRSLSVLVTVS